MVIGGKNDKRKVICKGICKTFSFEILQENHWGIPFKRLFYKRH